MESKPASPVAATPAAAPVSERDVEAAVRRFRECLAALRAEIGKVIVGHAEIVDQVLLALVAGGHVLLEGVPGLGKTLLVKTLSESLALRFARVQFTPDLMPADITGTTIVAEDAEGARTFQFQQGPVFTNVLLADEINRATPKTQSALLEAMQERSVTVAGTRYALEDPFFVLATQNPIEMEGTFPLPEAQTDRFFFKVEVQPSKLDDLVEILDRTTRRATAQPRAVLTAEDVRWLRDLSRDVPIASHVTRYAARLVLATHPETPEAAPAARKYVRYGASPRGAQALVLGAKILALDKGRYNVSFEDVRAVAFPALRHRVILNFEGEAEGIRPDTLLQKVLADVPEVDRAKK
ncbi:MAG: AAA family ATPase [Planctomycetes bacterium]|nr:AAA family ATPase [Planctomycetota bacterium]